jgi:hypothetical protein
MSDSIEVTAGLTPAFVLLVLVMSVFFVAGMRRGAQAAGAGPGDVRRTTLRWAFGLIAWLALTWSLAAAGVLRFDSMPPTMVVLLVATLVASFRLARSRAGERMALGIPLGLLVLSQAFRLPLELIMHRLYVDGLMPEQMSYSGLNFDILTGALAIPVGLLVLAGRAPRWLVSGWNVMGSLLLANVLVIAILSTPTPLRVFMNEPVNTWVTQAPWVWLPTLLVPCALIGHVLVFRALRRPAVVPATTVAASSTGAAAGARANIPA